MPARTAVCSPRSSISLRPRLSGVVPISSGAVIGPAICASSVRRPSIVELASPVGSIDQRGRAPPQRFACDTNRSRVASRKRMLGRMASRAGNFSIGRKPRIEEQIAAQFHTCRRVRIVGRPDHRRQPEWRLRRRIRRHSLRDQITPQQHQGNSPEDCARKHGSTRQLRRDVPFQNALWRAGELVDFNARQAAFLEIDLEVRASDQKRGQAAEERFMPG